jgi:4-amino-4-deoxy-L-arabinose transferase-like glycosyltransferase
MKNKKFPLIILGLIIVFGFILRIYNLGEQSFWIDEGFTMNAVLSTLEKGYPILDSGFHYSRSILNTYIISGFVAIFGNNHLTGRLPAVLFGTGLIYLIYVFTKKLFKDEKIALLGSALIAFSYIHIAWSRQARMYMQFEFFFYLSLLLFYLMLRKFSYQKLIALSLSTLAAILSHEFGLLLIGVYLFGALLYYWGPFVKDEGAVQVFKKKLNNLIRKYYLVLFVILAVIVPLISIKFYAHTLSRLTNFFAEGASAQEYFAGGWFILNLVDFYWLGVFCAILGMIIYIIKNKNLYNGLLLFISFVLPFFIIISSTDLFHLRYLTFLLPLLYVFTAYFIVQVVSYVFVKIKKIQEFESLGYLLIVILIIVFSANFIFLPTTYYKLEYMTPQPNFAGAYAAIRDDGFDENSIIISPYTAMDKVYLGRSDYWYPISLSGKLREIQNRKKSIYNNSPAVTGFAQFRDKDAYIIVDDMAINRLGDKFLEILKDEHELIYNDHSNELSLSHIWVFKVRN